MARSAASLPIALIGHPSGVVRLCRGVALAFVAVWAAACWIGLAAPGSAWADAEIGAERARGASAEDPPAYTLQRSWDELWLRIFDRGGRPDPDGPMLQRFFPPMDERYRLDLRAAELPLDLERAWARQSTGARLWIQSLDEVELANQAELRFQMPAWEGGFVGLEYQRREDWHTSRSLLRFDIGHRNIADTGASAAFRVYPGLDKDDIDLEGIASYRAEGVGEAVLRVGLLDPFTNASFGLIEAKGHVPEEDVRQLDIPLALSASARSERWRGLRAELYAGAVAPQTRRHRFAAEPERDHLRRRRALAGAALAEYAPPGARAAVGAKAKAVSAEMEWDFEQAEAGRDRKAREHERRLRIYALATPREALAAEAGLAWTQRPERWNLPGAAIFERDDRELRGEARLRWQPGRVGLHLRYLGSDRRVRGPPPLGLSGFVNRVQTHVTVELGPDIWTSFGAGWTWDPNTGLYDRAGMTLLYMP